MGDLAGYKDIEMLDIFLDKLAIIIFEILTGEQDLSEKEEVA